MTTLDTDLKVRFGFTTRGSAEIALSDFDSMLADLDRLGFDSIWIPEVMLGGGFDPVVALTHAAARTERLKIGSHLVVPGRSPLRAARELANLDVLSGGRLLLTMVLGLPAPEEVAAQGVEKSKRGAMLDECLPLLRRLWSGETVTHEGEHYRLLDASIDPVPVQQPLEMWLGGQLASAIDRVGRLGDGYLPGLVTPAEGAVLRDRVQDAAAGHGREIDREHFGVNLSYRVGALPEPARAQLAQRAPEHDPSDMVPELGPHLETRIAEWVAEGYSKFLLRPVSAPADWTEELEGLAALIMPLQT